MKKIVTPILLFGALFGAHAAQAGQAEVRDVALINNCTPKKTEIYQQAIGPDGDTVYRVECNLPKTVGADKDAPKPPDALLISCQMNLCEMLRPVTLDKK